jgi:hypothetical protein
MKLHILQPVVILIIDILFTGCVSQRPVETRSIPQLTGTFPLSSPVTTPVDLVGTFAAIPLTTPAPVDLSIRVSPERYIPLMSSTVGIGLTPQYTGPVPVVYSWNAPDFNVIQYNDNTETTDPTIYWSYSPDDMGKEKPRVTVRLIVKTPSRTHGGNGTIAWKDLHIHWENNDTAVIS